MEKEFLLWKMEIDMMGCGKMDNIMVLEDLLNQMGIYTWVNGIAAFNMELLLWHGVMAANMMVILKMGSYKDRDSINGLMEKNI